MKRKRTKPSLCACGCGQSAKLGSKYISGHNAKTPEARKEVSLRNKSRIVSEETRAKISKAHKGRKWPKEFGEKVSKAKMGHVTTEEAKEKMRLAKLGPKAPNWKGGVSLKNQALYDTYASQLDFIEEVRRDPEQLHLLQVKCTYCGRWFSPTGNNVRNRINCLNKPSGYSEMRFYCPGPGCRSQCSIYYRSIWPKGFKKATSREVQPELRKMVFCRDRYSCQKCGSDKFLHCHHIDPIVNNPIESADIDNCITLCKNCHKEAHKIDGCNYQELKCV